MDDAERRVAILDAVGDDAERHEVVYLIELDTLALELLVDAVEALQAPVNLLERNLRFAQFRRDRLFEVVDFGFGGFPLALHLGRERLIAGRIEVPERQLFELVLDLAHAEPVRDGRVDVERLLRGPPLPVFRHVRKGAHVVETVGELHEDDADVVDHREQHFPEILGLPLLAR